MSASALHRTVRLTARASAMLFAAAQAAPLVGRRGDRASRRLYAGFVAAHATHFAAVSRYAVVNGGRDLFPGGRSMQDVGGWPTVLGIYSFFFGLAALGRPNPRPAASGGRPPVAGSAANGLVASMFVGTYLGQARQSKMYAAPAAIVGAATLAGLWHDREVVVPTPRVAPGARRARGRS